MDNTTIDSYVNLLPSLKSLHTGGSDSDVYLSPDGRTVIRDYNTLKKRHKKWKPLDTFATIRTLKKYFKDTKEISVIIEKEDGFPKSYKVNDEDITIKCKIVKHGNMVNENGNIFGIGQQYIPKGFEIDAIEDPELERVLCRYGVQLSNHLKNDLKKPFAISEYNFSLTREGNTYTIWVTDLAHSITSKSMIK